MSAREPAGRGSSFSFGQNWRLFLAHLTDDQIADAVQSLQGFLGVPTLAGKRFLDIGCGSGLFSYAAYLLDAQEVVSFDLDADAVAATRALRGRAGSPGYWHVTQGSVLDHAFLRALGVFDVVYAWGSLHHTGRMWEAVRNSVGAVAPDGYVYLALYNRVPGPLGSRFWGRVKRLYNAVPASGKRLLERLFTLGLVLREGARGQHPLARMRRMPAEKRGMEWWTNVRDWLGGMPYEYATVEEVTAFMRTHAPAFRLVNLYRVRDLRNNWYLFQRDVRDHG